MSAVMGMQKMLMGNAFFDQPVGDWGTSSVTTMNKMCSDAYSFNQPLPWDVGAVPDTNGIFLNASSHNQPLKDWNAPPLLFVEGTFWNVSSYSQSLCSFVVIHSPTNVTEESETFALTSFESEKDPEILDGPRLVTFVKTSLEH